ncbi:MAG: polyether ionophore transport system permease protein [Streptosporangiaceae bacterium]|nr:polyether ionophore transport system permease protein [Streptosporangiaceae bacterium]
MTAVAALPRTAGRNGTSPLTGTGELARLALRRDRYFLPAWLYILTAVIASTAYSFKGLYPTGLERAALAASLRGNPSMTALAGPVLGDSLGALTMWKVGLAAAVGAALMGIFTVIRHTRADEEAGRLELVGSTVLGRQAALAASLVVAFGACLALAVLIAAAMILLGFPAGGALALGAAIGLTGAVFASVAAVTAQLSDSARASRGIAGGALGLAYLLRTVGDAGSGLSWLTWASPVGWAELLRPFADERWWVAVLSLVACVALTAAACLLAARRDLGAGLLPSRPGRARAPGWLRSPSALAWQLQRVSLLWWTFGFAVTGAVLGASAQGIGAALNSAQARDFITRLGGRGGLIDAYFAALILMLGVTAAAYGMAAALRPRTEESEQRAELVLATPTGRIRWVAGHLVIAAAGPAVLLGAAGLTAGLAYGLRTGDVGSQLPRLLGAALAQVPATWLMAGVAVAATGLVPRMAASAGWAALGVIALLTLVGPTLRLPQWVMDISPFTHLPRLPGGSFTAVPLVWLAGVALMLAAAGLAGLRRRDLG